MTWFIILFPIWAGFLIPTPVAYIIILFNVYFLYRSASFAILFIISLRHLLRSESLNWLNKLYEIDNINHSIAALEQKLQVVKRMDYQKLVEDKLTDQKQKQFKRVPRLLRSLIFRIERNKTANFIKAQISELNEINQNGINLDWKDIHHVIIIPHWKEPFHILEDTVERIKKSNYPTHKISIVMAGEKRDPEGYDKSVKLKNAYQDHFENFWITTHELKDNEIVGKSSNMASAGKFLVKEVAKLKWDLQKVIITSCDADSLLPKDYFANVSYKYATTANYQYKFYSAVILFYANIWELPFYARVKNSISSMNNLSRMPRTDKLVPFSTYSVSLWLIDRAGYWTPWVTPEDFHIFFKSLFTAPDKVSTEPIYQRILSDAAEGDTHMDTIKNTYFQERRWSWGISDDGWLIKNVLILLRKGKLPLITLYKSAHVIFDHVMMIGITMIGTVWSNIMLFINPKFAHTVLGTNLPGVASFMINITVWFLVFLIIVDLIMIKPDSKKFKGLTGKLLTLMEWIALPYTGFFLVILPGVEAHTRLLFGKYLEYYLTKKK